MDPEMRILLQKFYEGETDLAEEARLEAYFREHTSAGVEQTEDRELVLSLMALDDKASLDRIAHAVRRVISYEPDQPVRKTKLIHLFRSPWFTAAACLVFFMLGYLGGLWRPNGDPAIEQRLGRLETELAQTRAELVLTQIDRPLATERLQAVNLSNDLGKVSPELLSRLKEKILNDESTNVRLAAAYTLYKLKDRPEAVSALNQALLTEKEPVVQLALINLLVRIDDRAGRDSLKKFLEKTPSGSQVHARAQQGLEALSL